jgi:predicted molibdopterin-dependent oxidoreductase YjgC
VENAGAKTVTMEKAHLQEDDRRIEGAVSRGPRVEIRVDGRPVAAFEGESVAAALLAAGKRALRRTARFGEPRGLHCAIGVCFDCRMIIDGRPNVRACQMPVRAGMRVESQVGEGAWRVQP